MAFVPAVLDTTVSDFSSASSITSDAVSPGANSLVWAACSVRAGANQTYSNIAITDTSGDVGAWEVFSFPHPTVASNSIIIIGGVALAGAAPGSFTVTVSWSTTTVNNADRRVLAVGQIPDGFNSADLVAQSKTGSSTTSTLELTFDSAPDAASCILAFAASLNAGPIDPGTGFTELSDEETTPTNPDLALQTMYDVAPADSTIDWASLGTLSAGIALEIPAAVVNETLTFTDQPANTQEDTVMANIEVTSSDATATDIVTLTFGENPGSGTLGGDTTVAMVDGVATFTDIEIDNVGAGYTLLANATGHDEVESDEFDITLEPATHLVFFVGPSETQVDDIITPAVKVRARNSENIVDTNYTADVTLAIQTNPGTGTLGGDLTVAAVAGVATFSDLEIDEVGDGYVIRATSGALTLADSASFNITAGPASPSSTRAFSIRMGSPLTMRL